MVPAQNRVGMVLRHAAGTLNEATKSVCPACFLAVYSTLTTFLDPFSS